MRGVAFQRGTPSPGGPSTNRVKSAGAWLSLSQSAATSASRPGCIGFIGGSRCGSYHRPVIHLRVALSAAARRAEEGASGVPADAVLWEQVEELTSESARLSFSFVTFMVLATMIAATGNPNVYSAVVALLAGVVGVLSLTTAKSGALIGVLISVTTIPAAANIGVAAAYSDWDNMAGALAQLVVNIVTIVAAGDATLLLQRGLFLRRMRRSHAASS
jgi:NADH:ubiquinone oxidoreductase subunit K